MKLSTKKTEVMVVNKKEKLIHIKVKNGLKLNEVNQFKYNQSNTKAKQGMLIELISERI